MNIGFYLRVRYTMPDGRVRFLQSEGAPEQDLAPLLQVAAKLTAAGFPAFVAEQKLIRHEP